MPNKLDFCRLAISIRRNVASAVRRNYQKRVIREFFRKEIGSAKNYDFWINVKTAFSSQQRSQAEQELRSFFSRALKK